MIYVSNKLKYLFDSVTTTINEYGVTMGKFIYSSNHKDEVENIPYDDWDVIHKNGNIRDFRSENLELVVFKEE